MESLRVRAEGEGADGGRELSSKVVAKEVQDVVVESEVIVRAAGSSGSSSAGTCFTAPETELEVKDV